MQQIYNIVQPYLAALGLTALGFSTFFLAGVAAIKWFGEKWLKSKFDERLEAFKYLQQREIEQLKFQINASMDRAVKLHQREFEALPQAWAKLVTAYNSIDAFTHPFQSYADVGRMNEAELDEFLSDIELTNTQKADVKASDDRNATFQKALFWLRYGKSQEAYRTYYEFLLHSAIFIPPSIKKRFDDIGSLTWSVLIEHKFRMEHEDFRERRHRDRLDEEGKIMLLSLEEEIRQRLWSDVAVK